MPLDHTEMVDAVHTETDHIEPPPVGWPLSCLHLPGHDSGLSSTIPMTGTRISAVRPLVWMTSESSKRPLGASFLMVTRTRFDPGSAASTKPGSITLPYAVTAVTATDRV